MNRSILTIKAVLAAILLLALTCGAWLCFNPKQQPPRQEDESFHATGEKPEKIIVVDDRTYAPFAFLDGDGKPRGVTIDFWNLWSQKTGIPVEFRLMEWESALAAVRDGQADVVGGLFRTPQREEIFDFTQAFYRISTGVFFHRQILGIRGLDELDGFLVGVVKGDSAENFVRKQNPSIRIELCSDTENMVKAALAGKIKVFVADTFVSRFYLAKHGAGDEFLEAFNLVNDNQQYAAVRKGNQDLLGFLQQGFNRISEKDIRRIVDGWTGVSVLSRIPWTALWIVIVSIAAVLGFMLLWNLQLKKTIAKATWELRRRNEDLEKSERNYREMFNASSDMIFLHDAEDGRILDVNQAALDLCGYSRDQLIGSKLTSLPTNSPIFDGEEASRRIKQAESEGFCIFEWLTPRIDGTSFWTEVSLRRSQIGGKNRILAVVRDISARKKAEEAWQESELSFKTLFDLAPYSCAVHDGESHYLMVNKAFCILSGYSEEEVIGRTPYELGVVLQKEPSEKIHAELMRLGEIKNLEILTRSKSGKLRYVLFSCRIIKLGGQEVTLVITIDITERKQAEEALRESEERFRAIFNSSFQLTGLLTPAGILIEANQAALDFAGIKSEDVINQFFWEAYWWRGNEIRVQQLKEAIARAGRGDFVRYEVELQGAGGSSAIFDFSLKPIVNAEGKVTLLIPEGRDITDRKRAEETIHEWKDRYELIVAASGQVAYDYNTQTEVILWGSTMETVLGYCPAEYGGGFSQWLDWLHPDDKEATLRYLSEAEASCSYWDAQYRLRHKNGSYVWIRDRGFFIPDAAGKALRQLGMLEDITDRKLAEMMLRESEARYRSIVETTAEWIWEINREGDHTYTNRGITDILGYEPDEIIGKNVFCFLHPDDRLELEKTLPQMMAEKKGWRNFTLRWRRKDGSYRYLESNGSPLISAEGELLGYIGADRDITERINAEEALRESEEKYRLLLDHSSDLIWSLNAEGLFTYVSPSWKRVTGYEPSSLQGTYFQPLVHPDEVSTCLNYLHQVMQTKEATTGPEYRVQHVDGTWHWHTANGAPILGPDGQFISLVGVSRDITERKQAEEELRREQLLVERLLNSLPGIFYLYTYPELRLIRWNKNHETLLGYGPGEIDNRSIMEWHPPETKEAVIQAIETVMEKGQNTLESPLLAKDGRSIPFLMTGVRLELSNQLYLMGVGIDITERKKMEEALRESENHFRSMMEQSPFSIMVFSPKGDLLQLNNACERLWGQTKEESRNYNILNDPNILHFGILPLFQRAFTGERITIPAREYDLKATLGRGDRKIVQGDLYPLHDEKGAIRYIILVHQDLTDRVRAEEDRQKLQDQLMQAQKMESVGRLAGGVAHDFNNMLGVILGHTELALLKVSPDQPIHANLEEIGKAAHRSADLTRQLLAFARKQTVAPKTLDLNEAIEGMLKMLRRLIGENIHLSWLPGSNLNPVKIDPSQIDQIMANLCVNARDAIVGVGKITIETMNAVFSERDCAERADFIPGAYVMLAVSDDGCGMDKETQEKIFEPFFTTKETGQGTGLGLATVFGIVKQNCGFINVYSEPGQGSTFRIYLPRFEATDEDLQEIMDEETPRGGGETILIVEDEPAILDLGKTMLEMLDYRVLSTNAPERAIQLAKEHSGEIHLLMTDVIMPEMNGRDLARQLHSLYPNLKILFMSGYTADVIAHQGVLDPGVLFLQKPFSMKDLSAKVREALRSR